MSWIPVFGFELHYECNPETGEVRNANTKYILKTLVVASDRGDKFYYKYMVDLCTKHKRSKRLVSHIIAEAVMRTDLKRVPIHHIDSDPTNNRYDNLIVGFQTRNTRRHKVAEYKSGVYNKTYKSMTEFSNATGISPATLRRHNGWYELGVYGWRLLLNKRKNNALLLEVYHR